MPMTNAERQKAYRERQKMLKLNSSSNVTSVTPVTKVPAQEVSQPEDLREILGFHLAPHKSLGGANVLCVAEAQRLLHYPIPKWFRVRLLSFLEGF